MSEFDLVKDLWKFGQDYPGVVLFLVYLLRKVLWRAIRERINFDRTEKAFGRFVIFKERMQLQWRRLKKEPDPGLGDTRLPSVRPTLREHGSNQNTRHEADEEPQAAA